MYEPDWNTVYNTQNLNVQTQNVEAQNALARARTNASPGGFTTLGNVTGDGIPVGYNPTSDYNPPTSNSLGMGTNAQRNMGGGVTDGNAAGSGVGTSGYTPSNTTNLGGSGGIPNIGNLPVVSGGAGGLQPGQTQAQNVSTTLGYNQSVSDQQAKSNQFSASYIPEYSQTPILEEIAKYSRDMAPKVYQWGMDQFNKNQGNIDTLMRNAMSYASPQRIAANMGMAEAGVQQGAEAGRQSAIRDLQSFGIDPSSGRYAALDNASRVQSAASAAGAGNQQRMADTAQSNAMMGQAISSGLSNVQTGYGAAGATNALLGTASNLKYSPLGTISAGTSDSTGGTQSYGYNVGSTSGYNAAQGYDPAVAASISAQGNVAAAQAAHPPPTMPIVQYKGVGAGHQAAEGGYIDYSESPSDGAKVDDIKAKLTAGEFVIPRDVSEWMGQKFFYELMAKARKMRAMSNGESNGQRQVGYGAA